MPVAILIVIPAIRLAGIFLALATLAFGILVERLLYGQAFMFTSFASGRPMPRPSFAQSDTSYFYLVLAFVVSFGAVAVLLRRARLGRLLAALSDSEGAIASMGANTAVTKVVVYCMSAFVAGIGGILYGCAVHFASSSDVNYGAFQSLILLATLLIAPLSEPWYALIGGVGPILAGYVPGTNGTYWLAVIFGIFAITVAIDGGPPTMPAKLQKMLTLADMRKSRPSPRGLTEIETRRTSKHSGAGLQVTDLSVKFGGLHAVRQLSFNAPLGQITSLIGPNGAGKTTTFNACTGVNRKADGSVRFNGQRIDRLGAPARARRGIGRTFQRMDLCDSLSVADNVALGIESGYAGRHALAQVVASRRERTNIGIATIEAMQMCGIEALQDEPVGNLSTGHRRLVELARCIAGDFDLLLLDEPSSGLDRVQITEFSNILRRLVDERGCGVLLVEHDTALVLELSSYVYVLDFGELLFSGTPTEVASNESVKAAYLGDVELSSSTSRPVTPIQMNEVPSCPATPSN